MSRRTDTAHQAHQDLTAALTGLGPAIQRLMDARPALPGAASTDGTRGRGGTSSVEALALNGDPTAGEIRQLDQALRRLSADAQWLAGFVSRQTPRAPSDKDRREVERANRPDDGCDHHRAADLYEPAEHTGTVSDTLTLPMALCGFCYWQVRRKGVLPRGEVLVQRQVTGKDPRERVS